MYVSPSMWWKTHFKEASEGSYKAAYVSRLNWIVYSQFSAFLCNSEGLIDNWDRGQAWKFRSAIIPWL